MSSIEEIFARAREAMGRIGRKAAIRPLVLIEDEGPGAFGPTGRGRALADDLLALHRAGRKSETSFGFGADALYRGGKSSVVPDWVLDGPDCRAREPGALDVPELTALYEMADDESVRLHRAWARAGDARDRWAHVLDTAVWRVRVESARSVKVWEEDRARYSDGAWWWIWWSVLSRRWSLNERRGAPPGFLPSREVAVRPAPTVVRIYAVDPAQASAMVRALLVEGRRVQLDLGSAEAFEQGWGS